MKRNTERIGQRDPRSPRHSCAVTGSAAAQASLLSASCPTVSQSVSDVPSSRATAGGRLQGIHGIEWSGMRQSHQPKPEHSQQPLPGERSLK